MLFLHKRSDSDIFNAVNTGERPKGNDAAYISVGEQNWAPVWSNTRKVIEGLELGPKTQQMFEVFKKWYRATDHDRQQPNIYKMMSPQGMAQRQQQGISAEWRYYNNYVDLVLALYGEHCSAFGLKIEEDVSRALLANVKVKHLMINLTQQIIAYAEKTFEPAARDGLLNGNYKTLHKPMAWTIWKGACNKMTSTELLPFLYDITMSFKKKLNWSETPMAGGKITKDNMRMNVSTPEEDFDWTSRARWADVPVWAAPSYTTHLMLQVAQNAGAGVEAIQAFAYTISAFWSVEYPHTATPIHRMVGVMTAAREFNVPAVACEPETMYKTALLFMKFGSSVHIRSSL